MSLEQGHWPDPADFPGDKPEFELLSQRRWHPNPNVRDLPRDYPIDTSESDINPLMFAAVGGSTTLYAGHWTPFLPSDFRVKTLDGIAKNADAALGYDLVAMEVALKAQFGGRVRGGTEAAGSGR